MARASAVTAATPVTTLLPWRAGEARRSTRPERPHLRQLPDRSHIRAIRAPAATGKTGHPHSPGRMPLMAPGILARLQPIRHHGSPLPGGQF